jgi:hypothetical protein
LKGWKNILVLNNYLKRRYHHATPPKKRNLGNTVSAVDREAQGPEPK